MHDQTAHDSTFLPALARTSAEFTAALGSFDAALSQAILSAREPAVLETLRTLRTLERKIALFFSRIRGLLTREYRSEDELFIARFYFGRYSIISENTRAAASILKYVLGDLAWFALHSARIIEVLKTLYAELLSLALECRDLYRKLHDRELRYDFSFADEAWGTDETVPIGITAAEAFGILALPNTADREEVKSAFRRLAKLHHPDLNPGASRDDFLRIEQAYRRLLSALPA